MAVQNERVLGHYCDLVYWRPRQPSLPDNSPTTTRQCHTWCIHYGIRYHSWSSLLVAHHSTDGVHSMGYAYDRWAYKTCTQGWAHHCTPSHTINGRRHFSLKRAGWRSTRVVADWEQWLRECLVGYLSHSRTYPKVVYKDHRIGCSNSVYSLYVILQSPYCRPTIKSLMYPHTVETIVPLFFNCAT